MGQLGGLIRAAGFVLCTLVMFAAPAASARPGDCPPRAELDAAPGEIRAGDAGALQAFRADARCHHWITFYFAAEQLFASGARDEAVRWFYIGQLRGRTVAALDPNATPMMIDALQHIVGLPLNQYAGRDPAKWLRTLDEAIEWDRRFPMQAERLVRVGQTIAPGATSISFGETMPVEPIGQVSAQVFSDAYEEQRDGIRSLREALAHEGNDLWRTENGLR